MIRRETWIVLAVFVLALAGFFLWQRYGKKAEPQGTSTPGAASEYLFDFAGGKLQAVRLEKTGDQLAEFQRDAQGAWQITWPADKQADSATLESDLSQLSAVQVSQQMKNAPAFGDMGLDKPSYRLLLTLDSGSQLLANIGNKTPTGTGYYVLYNNIIYIVNSFSLDPILGLVDKLPLMPTPTTGGTYPPPEGTMVGTPETPAAGTTAPAGTTEPISSPTPVGTP